MRPVFRFRQRMDDSKRHHADTWLMLRLKDSGKSGGSEQTGVDAGEMPAFEGEIREKRWLGCQHRDGCHQGTGTMGQAVGTGMAAVAGKLITVRVLLRRPGRCFCRRMMCMTNSVAAISGAAHADHWPGMPCTGVSCICLLNAHHPRACHAIGKEAEQQGENEQIAFHACKRRLKGIFLSIGACRF